MDDPQTKNFTFVTMADVVDVMASYPSDEKNCRRRARFTLVVKATLISTLRLIILPQVCSNKRTELSRMRLLRRNPISSKDLTRNLTRLWSSRGPKSGA